MTTPVRFGLFVPQEIADAGLLREIAQTAERCGYHSLWVYDHLFNYPTPGNRVVLEAFTTMSLLAAWTQTIRIGALVLCDGYRNPALTAKMTATLDALSGGRIEFGYGAGWHEGEYRGYGYDFPPVATRIAMMEEALTIITRLWQGGPATFEGKHYRISDAICEPKPMQQPRPPITIGGGGEKLLLRAVARHADIWNYFPGPLPEYERKLAVLKDHCATVGRDPATLQQSLLVPTITAAWEKEVRDQLEGAKQRGLLWAQGNALVQGTPDIVVPRFRDYIRRGVSLFILALPNARDLKQIEFIAEAVMADLM
ncbi:MAG: TIGR03560 family F420-dependent LLM class oxidoreductase [Deltaproteobacteria bacterium]|nr:TIGR03560 family F420-dependent LLM class oxidoreductase [Deltaproteobacteria bacterium]MBI3388016.1 TIGR03560 family F420-dependent LLM class oxidoreductase [Deltaproteobacteria bacterium]